MRCHLMVCDCAMFTPFESQTEPNKAGTKVKRQAWTATAIAAFFEGLCEVMMLLWVYWCVLVDSSS